MNTGPSGAAKDARALERPDRVHKENPMATNDSTAENGSVEQLEQLEQRDIRALTQYLPVLDDIDRAAGVDGLYLVVSQSGNSYLVDAREDTCECPDHQYRRVRCKHLRRVAFATGERSIPGWVDQEGVDLDPGIHVEGPRFAAMDGGEIVDADAGDEGTDDDSDTDTDTDPDLGAFDGRPDDCECSGSSLKREHGPRVSRVSWRGSRHQTRRPRSRVRRPGDDVALRSLRWGCRGPGRLLRARDRCRAVRVRRLWRDGELHEHP